VAQLILQRQLYIRNTYKFKLSFEYCLLEPMDIVTITDSGIGLDHVAVRIRDIEEDDDGLLTITAEEFAAGTGTPAKYPVQGNSSNVTNQSVIPARVNPPVIYEPPPELTGGVAEVWIAASGGVAPIYKLAEDSSTGQHSTSDTLNASQPIGAKVSFSVYAKAAERSALRLRLYNGSTTAGCGFNLSTGAAGSPDTGISASIEDSGNGWFLCSIQATMAASANPIAHILIENPAGTSSYAGTSGSGLYVWGAAYSPGAGSATYLAPFTSATGATLATTSATNPPSGIAGRADPNWGGANVWLSTDGATYGKVGAINAPARQGVLTATLPAPPGGNPDTTDTLSVTLEPSGGTLASVTALDAANGISLCLVGDELLSYQTATLTASPPPNSYDLTILYRGLHGTSAGSHASGDSFAYVDGAIFKYPLPAAYIGVPLYLKLQSFNIFGQSLEDLSECSVYTYTPNGAGQALGPIASAISVGTNLNYGLASQAVTIRDDFGLASSPSTTVDMGDASS